MSTFKKTQLDFAAHIRDPKNNCAPKSVEERRLKIYRDLFINSIAGLLEGSFPVIRTLYNDEQWKDFIRTFFKKENNKTPYFPEIPREFVSFLKKQEIDPQKPFLAELAHYEWIELYLEKHATDERKNLAIANETELLTQKSPVISAVAELHSYNYPVHQIKHNFQPMEKLQQPLFIMVWRNQNNHVKFSHLNPFSALLFEKLKSNQSLSGQSLLIQMAQEHQHPDPIQFTQFGSEILQDWYMKDIIIDVR